LHKGYQVKFVLLWWPSWISTDRKKLKFVNYHPTIIHVLFDLHQISDFWDKLYIFFIFPHGPMLKLCFEMVAILDLQLTKKSMFFRRPYKEHSCHGTIPSHMLFQRRIFFKFKPSWTHILALEAMLNFRMKQKSCEMLRTIWKTSMQRLNLIRLVVCEK